ncbi:hypothetical protein VNI00_002035 [Paramarasmius palmivorus]|uniref:Uncharacterized protein n=1 Tax=Paramarasmius palmivorus TaxID=297713 RepID=A0AAW0E0E3_9AGAR
MSTLPSPLSLVVLQFDPVASAAHLDNQELSAACEKMKTTKYLAYVSNVDGLQWPHVPYHCWDIYFVFQGLRQRNEEKAIDPEMSMPILPNSGSPAHQALNREPLDFGRPLPWKDCYISPFIRTSVRCPTVFLETKPPTLMEASIPEGIRLKRSMREDIAKQWQRLQPTEVNEDRDMYDDDDDEEGSLPSCGTSMYSDSSCVGSGSASHQSLVETHSSDYDDDGQSNESSSRFSVGPESVFYFDQRDACDHVVCKVSFDLSELDGVNDPDLYFKEVAEFNRLKQRFQEGYTERMIDRARQIDDEYFAKLSVTKPDTSAPTPVPSEVTEQSKKQPATYTGVASRSGKSSYDYDTRLCSLTYMYYNTIGQLFAASEPPTLVEVHCFLRVLFAVALNTAPSSDKSVMYLDDPEHAAACKTKIRDA